MECANGHDPQPVTASPAPAAVSETAAPPAPAAAAETGMPPAPAPAPAAAIPETATPSAPAAALPSKPVTPPWAHWLSTAVPAAHAWLMRPRIRLSVTGLLLLLIGVLLMANSVWTLPLVIAGALMVVVAWIGHRLEGRFAVEWGDTGTQLAFRATIKPAGRGPEAPVRVAPRAHRLLTTDLPGDVIEGEAHTVEIDVTELKALIAAAESAEAPGAATQAAIQDIRIRRAPASQPAGRE
jgi:hypothetical protein